MEPSVRERCGPHGAHPGEGLKNENTAWWGGAHSDCFSKMCKARLCYWQGEVGSISELLEGAPGKEGRERTLCGFSLWKFVIVWLWGELPSADGISVTVLDRLDVVLLYSMGTRGLKVKLFFCLFVVVLIKEMREITSLNKCKDQPQTKKQQWGGNCRWYQLHSYWVQWTHGYVQSQRHFRCCVCARSPPRCISLVVVHVCIGCVAPTRCISVSVVSEVTSLCFCCIFWGYWKLQVFLR